jgi:probable HAF family extracellular repeat protein
MKRKVSIPGLGLCLVLGCIGFGLLFSAGAVVSPAVGQAGGASYFQGLSNISGLAVALQAWDVSANGTAVTGWGGGDLNDPQTYPQAYIWTEATGVVLLPLLPNMDRDSDADGLSADGSKVAGTCGWNYSGWEACVWTFDGSRWVVQGLGDLAGGDLNSHAYSMTPDGNVVVGEGHSAKGTEACRWTLAEGNWVLQGLGDFPKGDYWSQAFGASWDGSVVVGQGSVANHGTRAFRWTAATGMVNLGVVGKRKYSAAWGCSADGNVVVGESFSTRGRDEVAFRWTSATGMVGLGDLPGGTSFSEAEAVSPDGSIVVGGSSTANGVEAFIWDAATGMRRLADYLAAKGVIVPEGWVLRYANSATVNNGVMTIVGAGINPDGNPEAWIAVTVWP